MLSTKCSKDPTYVWYHNWRHKKKTYYPEMTASDIKATLWSYMPNVAERVPEEMIGLHYMPLHETNYEQLKRGNKFVNVPRERTFHQLCMRTGFTRDDQYLRLDDLIQTVYQEVAPLFETDAFCIALYDEEADELDLRLCVDRGVPETVDRLSLSGAGLTGYVVSAKKPLLVHDLEGERVHLPCVPSWSEGEAPLSWLGVPIRIGERVMGVICMHAYRSHVYGEEEQLLLSTIADEVAVAVENARLFEAVEEQRGRLRALTVRLAEAEDSERRRLARELHDQVGQNLTALGINLNILRTQMPEGMVDSVSSRLDDSLALVEQTAERIRDVMSNLRPPLLDEYGLVAALHWYGSQFAARTGVAVGVEGEEPAPRLATPVENALFRIVQEALTNVVKHAQATRVTVAVEAEDGTVRLVVADDGVGFSPGALVRPDGHRGWGLLTMAERAEAMGGRCRIESSPDQGTRIIAEVER